MINAIGTKYVLKAQYNKDKELLFVTTCECFGNEKTTAYETVHLELLPTYVRSGLESMSCKDKDGLIKVFDMASKDELIFYKNENYWNLNEKNYFMSGILNLWNK